MPRFRQIILTVIPRVFSVEIFPLDISQDFHWTLKDKNRHGSRTAVTNFVIYEANLAQIFIYIYIYIYKVIYKGGFKLHMI